MKNAAKPKATSKSVASPVNTSDNKDLREIIDHLAKELQKHEGMIFVLQGEIKDLKRMLISQPAEKKKPAESAAIKTASAKKVQKTPQKAVSVQAPKIREKSSSVKKPVASPAKNVKKPVSQAFSDNFMAIPADFAERITALTSKKKITQTQLGKEVDLSQKVIHEIVSGKLKDLDKEKVRMIAAVLKKYEGK